jgi:DNA-binding beta-propeller fold protein YncE
VTRRGLRSPTVIAVAALVVAVAAVGIWAAAGGPRRPDGGGRQAAAGSPVVASVSVDDTPRQVMLAADGLWALGERALYRIDPESNRVVATIPLGTVVAAPAALALAGGAAWVPAGASSTLWRVDRATGRLGGRIGLDRRLLGPVGVAAQDGTVWVSCCALQHGPRPAGVLLRVDTRRNRVVARIPIADGPLAVTAGDGAVWVATARGGVLRVDPESNRVVGRVPLAAGSRVEAIAATPRGIWAVDTGDYHVLRLDPGSGRVGLAVAAPLPRGVGVGDGGAWVIVTNDRTLARVDERDGRLGARVPADVVRDVRGIAVGAGALWVTTGNQVLRLDPRRLP